MNPGAVSTKYQTTTNPPKDKVNKDMKGVVCFKCHGHGHFKSECPNVKAFTLQKWTEIKEISGAKAMLISKNGIKEVVWPSFIEDDPNDSYFGNDVGTLKRFKDSEPSEDEEDRELVYPELEQ